MDSARLGVEWVSLTALFCSPSNPRHNDEAVPHVAASLRRFGWQQPIVAKPSGEVIAGNTRFKAAKTLGMTEVPVVRFEGSDLEAAAFAIADNRTHEFASWDDTALSSILQNLRAEDALDGVGYSSHDIDALIDQLQAEAGGTGDADLDAIPEPPDEATTACSAATAAPPPTSTACSAAHPFTWEQLADALRYAELGVRKREYRFHSSEL